jgi:hypothetical protein
VLGFELEYQSQNGSLSITDKHTLCILLSYIGLEMKMVILLTAKDHEAITAQEHYGLA